MSFDGSFTHAMVRELNQVLTSGRITKIHQPYENEVIITFRAHRKNYPVLLSAHPNYARVQITEIPYANPAVPTNFAMMLRKYLDGAILNSVSQVENDRIINFSFSKRNELGDTEELLLAVEIMGRRSNIILLNNTTKVILDTIKHINADQNRYRLLLPGATYITPPSQNKLNPFTDTSHMDKQLQKTYPNQEVLATELRKTYQGLNKDTSLELAYFLHQHSTDQAFTEFFSKFDHIEPTMTSDHKKSNFTAFPYLTLAGTTETFPTLSRLLDTFYAAKAQRDRVIQKAGNLVHVVKNDLKKNRTKLKKLDQTLASSEKADAYKIKGEILTTYLNQVKRGMTEITLPNYYDENRAIKISLSNQISPSQNAQKYFKKYQKAKNAVHFVNEQLAKTHAEIDYLDTIMTQIELANPEDLDEIREELEKEGYLKPNQKKRKQKRVKPSQPDVFYATDGTKISVGKNDAQNDRLTLKTAKKTDIWLHTQKIPGSHVIIHTDKPSQQTLVEAATLAAYFSKAQNSAHVPVDYVAAKRVHKPNGAKPGFVIYEGQNTLIVDPDEKVVNQLKTKQS
ncbi:NFACT RNA binding domain-containing protein [Pediococcus siamensis]|uniref:NFACT RNA binding domain-containing protein n=1 Tax=Pediococcus siamensis TaxID=381829 RepID=UPI00399FAEAB